MSSDGVTAPHALEIVVHHRGTRPTGVPEDWLRPSRVTEKAPDRLYRTWPEEPAWYVWFRPTFVGLGPSTVIVVSQRTGAVIGSASACDDG